MKKQFCRMSGVWMLLTIAICLSLSVLCFCRAAGPKMSIRIRNGKRTVAVGKKLDLKASIHHKRQGAKLVWKSSSKKIATVSKHGVVSGKKTGRVKITARIRGTSVKHICKIRVTKKEKNKSGQKTPIPQKTSKHQTGTGNVGKDSGIPDGSGLPVVTPAAMPTDAPWQDSETPTDSPMLATPEPGSITKTPKPGNETKTPEPGGVTLPEPDIPAVSPEPGITPDRKELVPYSAVMEIQGELTTVFLVNKNYEGQVHVRINGKEFAAEGSAKDAILLLAYGGTTKTDGSNRIRLSRTMGQDGILEPYWILEDLEQGESYRMKVETRNTVNPSFAHCGVIYFPGDVTSAIEVY